MTETLWELVLAGFAFVGAHITLSSAPLRAAIVGRTGEKAFLGLYSLLMAGLLTWMILGYAGAPLVAFWTAPPALFYGADAVIAVAFVLVLCGATTPNPTMVSGGPAAARAPEGIMKVTRHPVMWGIGLWALAHMAVNGDAASLAFFGALALLAFAGMGHIDAKKRRAWGADWEAFAARTSVLPLAAVLAGRTTVKLGEVGVLRIVAALVLFAVILYFHDDMIGVSPLP